MSETLTDEQVEEILRGCEGVTPGPWAFTGLEMTANGLKIVDCLWGSKTSDGVATYRHIARLDPQTVSSLATELLALRKRVGELERGDTPIRYVTLGLGEWLSGTYLRDDILPSICFGPAPEPKQPGEVPTEEAVQWASRNGSIVISFASLDAAVGMLDLVKEAVELKERSLPTPKEPS